MFPYPFQYKHYFLKFSFVALLLACSVTLQAADQQPPAKNDNEENIKSSSLPNLPKISGYIQAQGYYEDSGTGDPKTTFSKAGLRIPRARLKASGDLDEKILAYEFQLNANETEVALEDAFMEIHFLKRAFFTAGRFTMPFGDEIYLTSKKNPFVERSRFWNFILKEKRNIGAMLTVEPADHWVTEVGYFSTFYDATTPKIQDALFRTSYQWDALSTGISFYYDDKTSNGKIYEIEKEADVYVKYKNAGFLAAVEFAARFISPAAFEFTGVARTGWHAYLCYMLDTHWEAVAKYAFLAFDKSLNIKDDQVHDVIAGINYHFSEYNKIQLNYNPAFHADKKISQAVMLQIQAAF